MRACMRVAAAGYGVEALQYMSSLLQYKLVRPEDLWIRQSGDGRDAKYTDQLPADKRDLLAFQQYDEITKVCGGGACARPHGIAWHGMAAWCGVCSSVCRTTRCHAMLAWPLMAQSC